MIQLTPAAQREIDRIRQRQHQPDAFCRLDLQPSSCGQWAYALSLDVAIAEDDERYNFAGLQVLVQRDRLPYLRDLTIDFFEDLTGGAFRFDNPIAIESCRCGYAFTASESETGQL